MMVRKMIFRQVFINFNIVFCRSIKVSHKVEGKDWSTIPGPSSLPIIGQIHHFLPGRPLHDCSGYDFQYHLYKNYGPIVKLNGILGRRPIIFLFDIEASAQVLRGENWLPNRPGFETLDYFRNNYSKQIRDSDKPTGLANDQGEKWKKLRIAVNPIILQRKTLKQYSNVIGDITMEVIERIKILRNSENKANKLDMILKLWALESICVIALGCRLYCFDPNLPENSPAQKFVKIIEEFFDTIDKLEFKPSLWRYISTPAFRKAMTMYEEEEKLVEYFIQCAHKYTSKESKEISVLESLLAIDEKLAVILAGDLIFGGVDTVANTILNTLYLLAINPEVQSKLRHDIMTDREEQNVYLKSVIKESMRMLPVPMGNIRATSKSYEILGYNIPNNMQVSFGHQLLSMMETHYPNPTKFIPERWLVEKDHRLYHGNAHPLVFSPFGFGARSCIGRRIAEMELEIFLKAFLKEFRVDWNGPPPKHRFTTLNFMAPPFNYIISDL